MSKNNKYEIYFKGQLIPVNKEFYEYYNKSTRKIKYIEEDIKQENIKVFQKTSKVIIIPSREDSYERLRESGVEFKADVQAVEDYITQKVTLDNALRKLSPQEYRIIDQLYFKGKTERTLAKEMGINQQSLNERKARILAKLHKLLKF